VDWRTRGERKTRDRTVHGNEEREREREREISRSTREHEVAWRGFTRCRNATPGKNNEKELFTVLSLSRYRAEPLRRCNKVDKEFFR